MKLIANRTLTIKPGRTADLNVTLDLNPEQFTEPVAVIQSQLETLATSNAASIVQYLVSKWRAPMPALQSVWLLPGANGSVTPFRITGINESTRTITAQAMLNAIDVRNLTPEQFEAAGLLPLTRISNSVL